MVVNEESPQRRGISGIMRKRDESLVFVFFSGRDSQTRSGHLYEILKRPESTGRTRVFKDLITYLVTKKY